VRTRRAGGVRPDVCGEDLQRTAHKIDRAIGMPARAPPFDLVQSAMEANQKAAVGLPPGQPGQVVGDGR